MAAADEELQRLKAAKLEIADAVLKHEGLGNCIKIGCDSCNWKRDKSCNSKPIVDAVKEYLKLKEGK